MAVMAAYGYLNSHMKNGVSKPFVGVFWLMVIMVMKKPFYRNFFLAEEKIFRREEKNFFMMMFFRNHIKISPLKYPRSRILTRFMIWLFETAIHSHNSHKCQKVALWCGLC